MFLIYFFFILSLKSIISIQLNGISPSFAFQILCNNTETRVLRKIENILNYSSSILKEHNEDTLNYSQNIGILCKKDFSLYGCKDLDKWNDTLEEMEWKKTVILRNITDLQENILEIENTTNETNQTISAKIQKIQEKIQRKKEDVEMLEEVEKLVNSEDFIKENKSSLSFLLEKVKRTAISKALSDKKMKKFNNMKDIIEQVLLILREIREKFQKQLLFLKKQEKALENWLRKKLELLSASKASYEAEISKLQENLLDLERNEKSLGEKIKKCNEIIKFESDFCKKIENTASSYIISLNDQLSKIQEIILTLKETNDG